MEKYLAKLPMQIYIYVGIIMIQSRSIQMLQKWKNGFPAKVRQKDMSGLRGG